jgi:hypothetical protein
VLAVNATFGFPLILAERAGVLATVKDKAHCRTGRRPSLTSAACADLGVSDRDGGMIVFQFEQRNRGSHRGSGWHGDSRIERFACLQHTKTENQELAHGSDDDLFGLETTRLLEARDKGSDGGIEMHRGSAGM